MTLDECEEAYMNGVADEETGDTDRGPINHTYRVGACLVDTTSTGMHHFMEYPSEDDAIEMFRILDTEYSEWEGSEDA